MSDSLTAFVVGPSDSIYTYHCVDCLPEVFSMHGEKIIRGIFAPLPMEKETVVQVLATRLGVGPSVILDARIEYLAKLNWRSALRYAVSEIPTPHQIAIDRLLSA